jgi:hypothetical protein
LSAVPEVRHHITAKQACEIADVAPSTLRNWLRQGLISAVRVGNGAYRYDPAEITAMIVTYPRDDVDERIRELVEGAPEFTPQQVNRIRLLLHSAPAEAKAATA